MPQTESKWLWVAESLHISTVNYFNQLDGCPGILKEETLHLEWKLRIKITVLDKKKNQR